ncbi:hypothetical protein OH76DRAFT_943692 [Lentinus brumalis]|uniref:Uncharacterized protein n=1 Tax=Lentinus brumalis TaxID=2498619 RepID=A0A371CZ07_9APHY|nr:hypothetical protein OH76DRAFT_943692 [Polyporus brumalis]
MLYSPIQSSRVRRRPSYPATAVSAAEPSRSRPSLPAEPGERQARTLFPCTCPRNDAMRVTHSAVRTRRTCRSRRRSFGVQSQHHGSEAVRSPLANVNPLRRLNQMHRRGL